MGRNRKFAVYILASKRNGTLYIGMTGDFPKRIWLHKNHFNKGFSDRYNVTALVWIEWHDTADAAIAREKQLKKWNRAWKLELIEKDNPDWRDLYDDIFT